MNEIAAVLIDAVKEDVTMTNGMDPEKMAPAERLDEVATLLSLAMLRLRQKRRAKAQSARLDERDISRERVTIPLVVSRNDGSV
jgi:hypothetical protein